MLAGAFGTCVADDNLLTDLAFRYQAKPPTMATGAMTPATDAPPTDEDAVLLEGHVNMTSVQQIEVDPDTTYELSGWFKSAGSKPSILYFGLRPLDMNRHDIWPMHVFRVDGSETEMKANAAAGDKVIRVADASTWREGTNNYVVFNADTSGDYSDLPNRSGVVIKGMREVNGVWEIELDGPLPESYAAGTWVRQHTSGAMHIYNGASGVEVPFEWTYYSGTIRGVSKGWAQRLFWPGTQYVSVLVSGNYMAGPDVKLLVGGLRLLPK